MGFRSTNRAGQVGYEMFQSLRGVLVGFRAIGFNAIEPIAIVSIPKRGFGGFSPNHLAKGGDQITSFNP